MKKGIEIKPYNPTWPKIFGTEAIKIKQALDKNCINIYHIGSTSVPSLAAKDKIDIIAEVKSLQFSYKELEGLGYTYRGSFNIPLRKSFTYRSHALNVNLHIFEENDPEIELNILFRDYLRGDKDAQDQYEKLKYSLIEDESSHIKKDSIFKGYTLGKQEFIHNIIKQTGFKGLRVVISAHTDEWEAVKYFRNRYYATNDIKDQYTWTFDHKEHAHLILYKGVNIIGYAHIQFWPNNRAAIRIIVVNEDKQNENAGSRFLTFIEKWLKFSNIRTIQAESRESSLNFYLKNGYKEMSFSSSESYKSDSNNIVLDKVI